ncbi:carcinoembryonic antigen-related cell adhesion molecule 4-like [Antechinus flavipes]|uniref:carcinoembryonic antigen-related cell adhesion molecule 4-like n=1 Tax=Antechinus flavipes TaxID=38775 RepID=UPI002235B989|nr:carcinoembryonic antigen-related cell adhesion molecule 4-like [Antechinus flavipes]
MESCPEIPHSAGSLWKGLLITAALLSTWIQSESTESPTMQLKPSPPYGMVGSNITLSILGLSQQPGRYTWFRKNTKESNRIVTYIVQTGQQIPDNGRETVFPNGSLLITNLTLSDSDEYIVELFSTSDRGGNFQLDFLRIHLQVYGDLNFRGGVMAGIVIGVLAGLALTGVLIYFLFIRKTGGVSQGMLGDPGPGGRTQKHRQVLENNIYLQQDSTPSAQDLNSTPTISAAASENLYQALDISKVDIYDSFDVMKKPETKESGKIS